MSQDKTYRKTIINPDKSYEIKETDKAYILISETVHYATLSQ